MTRRRPDRLIRASELARWAYCQRAWWLEHVQGMTPDNLAALAQGRVAHDEHARLVRRSERYRRLARVVALVGGVLLLILLALILRR